MSSNPSRTRIKICGITDEEGLFAACDAGADAVGFVFYPKSPRFIEPEEAFDLISFLPPFVSSVGLFVDAKVDRFMDIEETCPTDRSQLHGSESEDVVKQCGPSLIKAVRFDPATIERELKRWSAIEEVDAVLVDGSAGGAGETFDWGALAKMKGACSKPLILAGGLTPENVGEAIRVVRPFAVDVSSGVETAPGEKSRELINAFCRAVRKADAEG
jgi:phosphoribosylanthranilate isomerase